MVQEIADNTSQELTSENIWDAFQKTYRLTGEQRFSLVEYDSPGPRKPGQDRAFVGRIVHDGQEESIAGRGNGLLSSALNALSEHCGLTLDIADYHEHALKDGGKDDGSRAKAACYLECETPEGHTVFGVGIDEDVSTASIKALLSAANQIP